MANTPNIVRAIGNQLGTTLNAGISSSASSITLVDATGFSTDGGYIIIDENITGKEEIVYVTGVAGSTLTVATDGRGRCGTSATSHDAGATVSDILVDEHINGIADKFIIEHNDDGTHTEDYATLTGTQELTNKTLTSPTVNTPTLVLADSSPTADGSIGYDRTNEEIQIGDGANSLSARMGAWAAWTPTISAGTGSFTNVTGAGRWAQLGKVVFFQLTVTVTTVGTGVGVLFSLPVSAQASGKYLGGGRENASTGKQLQVYSTSTSQAKIWDYNNMDVSTNGYSLVVNGFYEAA